MLADLRAYRESVYWRECLRGLQKLGRPLPKIEWLANIQQPCNSLATYSCALDLANHSTKLKRDRPSFFVASEGRDQLL